MKLFVKKRKSLAAKGKEGKLYIEKKLSWTTYCQTFIQEVSTLFPQEVSSSIYDAEYFGIHHEYPVEALRNERRTRLNRAITYLQVKKGQHILDLGSGNGELSITLAEMGANVWGIDYSHEAVIVSEKRRKKLPTSLSKKISFKQMDARTLDFADNFFDSIICLDVFEHIYPEPLEEVIDEMTRVTKHNGRIVIETAPNIYFWGPVSFIAKKIFGFPDFESDAYHINMYDYFRFKKTLKHIPGKVKATLFNDGHWFFSSRIEHSKGAFNNIIRVLAKIADFLHENPVSEKIILHSPLKLFLAHDLWGVVIVNKKPKKNV